MQTEIELQSQLKELITKLANENQTSIPKEFILGLADSDDWSLIIKLHSFVELSLNTLVINAMGDKRVSKIVTRLDTSDKQKGKLAFIKAFELLPNQAITFISKLSELRNQLVHNLYNFNFSLSKWIKEMPTPELLNLTKSLEFGPDKNQEFWYSKEKEIFRNLPHPLLKLILISTCMVIFIITVDHEFDKFKEPLVKELERLKGLRNSYEGGLKNQTKANV